MKINLEINDKIIFDDFCKALSNSDDLCPSDLGLKEYCADIDKIDLCYKCWKLALGDAENEN